MQTSHAPKSSTSNPNRLTSHIMISLVFGVAVGWVCHHLAGSPAKAKEIAGYLTIPTDIFLRLIKMIIAPLVFATIVSGIASLGASGASATRIAARALSWFIAASLASLGLGLLFANLLAPGKGLAIALPAADASTGLARSTLDLKDFAEHVFPTSIVQAMATNDILQILIFSIFFGSALASYKDSRAKTLAASIEEAAVIMLRVTDYVMRAAPVAVFAAIAAVITVQGLDMLISYGKFIGSFYVGLLVLWCLMGGMGYVILGRSIFNLFKLLREPMLIAFATASSEAAYPKMLEQLLKFGVRERVSSFVLPLGYSFNLDGSMMYQAFAALFVAQAYGVEMSLGRQIALLLVMMVTSKGTAGVARASLVVIAATLPMFDLPAGGLLLILGIDQFLDMGRTMTNVIGNGVATAVVAKWENELDQVSENGALRRFEV